MKKNKKDVNVVLECNVTQSHQTAIAPVKLGRWDIATLTYKVEASGLIIETAQRDPKTRRALLKVVNDRFNELLDAAIVTHD